MSAVGLQPSVVVQLLSSKTPILARLFSCRTLTSVSRTLPRAEGRTQGSSS
jgi:hypothetical protein